MFVRDQDFVCDDTHGIIRCLPKTAEAASAYKVLQLQLMRLVPHLPEAPAVTIAVDGIIGPSAVLALQMIALRLCDGAHQELAQLALAQPEQSIPLVAENAMEIAGYIDQVMSTDPTAIIAPKQIEPPELDPVAMLKQIFTKKRVAASVAMLGGLGGLALVAGASDRRALGHVDRSRFLPVSDGSDEFEDDDESDEGDEDDESNDEDTAADDDDDAQPHAA